ncbi:MAG: aminotransferase class I/II-fold pyridoxal phosphate-dependent enzyme [Ruminiclostridium sp.]|nr:aminotransferase class I/II-fold pyridoxal phosphate-dependent enzyme [Ruminiclostridium sp.]
MLYQTNNPHGGDIYGKPVLLDYSANTNPYGTPPGVLETVRESLCNLHRYPDPYCRKLIAAIAEFEGVPPEYILCGSGAAELIYSYCEAVAPKRAVELSPTFSEYALGLRRVGCTISRYALREDNSFGLDRDFLPFLEKTRPEAVFLCNPNNPTGRLIEPSLLKDILALSAELDFRLFVDECFLDLSNGGESMKPNVSDNPRLFVLKAFTKNYGMAGLRLGYCITADRELLYKMSQTVQPWNVSVPAQAAGIAALKEQAFLAHAKETIAREKRWLFDALTGLGLWACPSDANYLLFKAPGKLHERLLEEGISIRNCDNYHGLGSGWYRIAVRQHEENEQLISAMERILQEG